MASPQAGRLSCQPVLHADSSDLHPGVGLSSVEVDADERELEERRARLGPESRGRPPLPRSDPGGRARLLPRAPVPELRQPRTSGRRVAKRQVGVRRGPRRRRERPCGLPGFQRRDQATRRRRHPGALRQPLRHVPEDHRRRSVCRADADLPGDSLHDGRALGRLQPDEHDSRAPRAGRGELLGPRRQSARRERPDAGTRRTDTSSFRARSPRI